MQPNSTGITTGQAWYLEPGDAFVTCTETGLLLIGHVKNKAWQVCHLTNENITYLQDRSMSGLYLNRRLSSERIDESALLLFGQFTHMRVQEQKIVSQMGHVFLDQDQVVTVLVNNKEFFSA